MTVTNSPDSYLRIPASTTESLETTITTDVNDPETDPCFWAWLAPGDDTSAPDWQSAEWRPGKTNVIVSPTFAVDGSATVQLQIRTPYRMQAKVGDSPESPTFDVGTLYLY